jgi:hypothetical protein
VSTALEAELLVHLDAQIASARRLLSLVLEQGKAIRARDVEGVLARLTDVQSEILLAEIAREHGINRALMRQELAFLAHLTRLVGQEPEPGYGRPGGSAGAPVAPVHRVLDLQA